MTDIVIVGTGGLAREVHEIIEDLISDGHQWNPIGFVDDVPKPTDATVHDLPVLGGTSWLGAHQAVDVVVAVGSPSDRRRVAERLTAEGHSFPALVHPLARVGRRCTVGAGGVVFAGAHLTTDLVVGEFGVVYPGCTITHDDQIGAYATLAPGVHISGGVSLGTGSDVGAGAVLVQGITVGEWSVIGAGAVVTHDLPANCTAVGVPAKPIRVRPDGWQLQ